MDLLPIGAPGTLGSNVGAGSDGVLLGAITVANPTKGLLKSLSSAGLCYTDDGGSFVNETTPFGESTGDDVEVLPSTPANADATYFGHATKTFARVDVNVTTDGDGTWTITYEYWNGSAWTALAGVTDGTTGWEGGTGWKSITFTLPTDWDKTEIDSLSGYWIRGVVSGFSAVTTAPQVGQGWIILAAANADWSDDTTDLIDAGTDDVPLLPTYPIVGDGFYIGYSEKFCKVKMVEGQARTGTATLVLKYWDGSAWTAIPTVEDDSVGWSTAAGTLLVNFVPPSDWVANTAAKGPNGQTGFFVVMELTVLTSVTAQPLGTQAWVLPLVTGASGFTSPVSGTFKKIRMNALTASATNGDSIFLLINATTGAFAAFTWTKAVACMEATISLTVGRLDEVMVVQIAEDGTTEFANGQFLLSL